MACGASLTQSFPYMSQGIQRLVSVRGTDDDGLCTFKTVYAVDHRQTTTLRRLVDEDKSAVMLTLSDGCCEDL